MDQHAAKEHKQRVRGGPCCRGCTVSHRAWWRCPERERLDRKSRLRAEVNNLRQLRSEIIQICDSLCAVINVQRMKRDYFGC